MPACIEVPGATWLCERGNYRINPIFSLLTGSSAAAASGDAAKRRDPGLRQRELGWSEERLGARLAGNPPRFDRLGDGGRRGIFAKA